MLYEIVLICPFCSAERHLDLVSADSAYEALAEAERRNPDARYEEMHARRATLEASPRQLKIAPTSLLRYL